MHIVLGFTLHACFSMGLICPSELRIGPRSTMSWAENMGRSITDSR